MQSGPVHEMPNQSTLSALLRLPAQKASNKPTLSAQSGRAHETPN